MEKDHSGFILSVKYTLRGRAGLLKISVFIDKRNCNPEHEQEPCVRVALELENNINLHSIYKGNACNSTLIPMSRLSDFTSKLNLSIRTREEWMIGVCPQESSQECGESSVTLVGGQIMLF